MHATQKLLNELHNHAAMSDEQVATTLCRKYGDAKDIDDQQDAVKMLIQHIARLHGGVHGRDLDVEELLEWAGLSESCSGGCTL